MTAVYLSVSLIILYFRTVPLVERETETVGVYRLVAKATALVCTAPGHKERVGSGMEGSRGGVAVALLPAGTTRPRRTWVSFSVHLHLVAI